jgi:UDP-N-acetylmuramoyl-L-alanyl-D-glutamate--2,6-diaminopimelate ligase
MTSTDPRTGARVSSEAVTPAFPPVSFADLVATVPGATIRGDAAVPVTDVAFDSREVTPGAVFFCVPGLHVDGHAFASKALQAGAVALVVERWIDVDVPQALVPSVRGAMGQMSSSAFGDPASAMAMCGVTGTNGKTTITYVLSSIFGATGWTAGVVGTTGASVDGRAIPLARTTPEAPDLQRLLARMRDDGVRAAALEVSSHALDQHRVDGVVFDVAVFTNLSQDHLDFHADMDAYFEAKARLFTPEHARSAVVNADDAAGRRLLERLAIPVVTYGTDPGADVRGEDVMVSRDGIVFTVGGLVFSSQLRGAFNVENLLAAVAAARSLGIEVEAIRAGVAAIAEVPGRMEPVEAGQDFLVVVDYAHTPDSIRSVLRASRPLTSGRLILVFGCGGDRDRAKRSPMGAAATADADLTIVTTDNPRSEDPSAIIAEIEPGAKEGGGSYVVEPDRRSAIRLALREAGSGDVVIVAGKGHEQVQEFRDRTVPFDDRTVVREELAARGGVA